ncbi:HTH-type transcriptional activator RhaS [Paenibacillus allorhizoplanae]|uniref:HTH-type transcriptional activator RhaS n=1 Tax=Paenibacillus allorhizoplanae TaxID=2905648 RepID=A0ABN8G268_9BACL|nr:AraC family transcriptional regulator [Paenibacillus allorhizoplanae]CAH1192413.1 HTH-type transcriptional activator RhaS [Paenibacillus allorhizoplanae]
MENYGFRYIHVGYSHHRAPHRNQLDRRNDGVLMRLQVNGTCRVELNGISHHIRTGDLIISRPGSTYQLFIGEERGLDEQCLVDSADYYVVCGGEWVDQWLSSQTLTDVAHIEVNDDLLSLWRRLIYEKRNLHENNTEIIACCAKLLCLTLERSVVKMLAGVGRKEHFIANKLKQYIEKHATEALTLEELAARNGVSTSTASHMFKLAFGMPPMRYAVEVRLVIASERILYSDMRLEDAAEASGFRSYPYFCRAFRTKYGQSPSEYRTQHWQVDEGRSIGNDL